MSKTSQKKNSNSKSTNKRKVVKKTGIDNKKVSNKSVKKVTKGKSNINDNIDSLTKNNLKMMFVVILSFGTLFIFASYAWFSTNLNVKINTFQMTVNKNSGLEISLDGVNFDTFVEISEDILVNELKRTYPNNISQWAAAGLTPVSTVGIRNSNSDKYDIYASSGVRYRNIDMKNGYFRVGRTTEDSNSNYNNFIAFDIFLKNNSGSPVSDNLYLESTTEIKLIEDTTDEMVGLFNSLRLGFLKIGSVPLNASVNEIQNVKCNNSCTSIIYEPNALSHIDFSIEKALNNGVTLVDGEYFPTYGCINSGGPIFVKDAISGSPRLDYNYFKLQETITDADLEKPLFSLPSGITKVRLYLWVEGQDIDSLETDSSGTKIDVSINLMKDTAGQEEY